MRRTVILLLFYLAIVVYCLSNVSCAKGISMYDAANGKAKKCGSRYIR